MPPLPSEVRLLIENLMTQVQQQQNAIDQMHSYLRAEIDRANDQMHTELTERLRVVDDDIKQIQNAIHEIKETQLPELRAALVANQKEYYRRIIAAQAAILLAVLAAILGVVFQYFHH